MLRRALGLAIGSADFWVFPGGKMFRRGANEKSQVDLQGFNCLVITIHFEDDAKGAKASRRLLQYGGAERN